MPKEIFWLEAQVNIKNTWMPMFMVKCKQKTQDPDFFQPPEMNK